MGHPDSLAISQCPTGSLPATSDHDLAGAGIFATRPNCWAATSLLVGASGQPVSADTFAPNSHPSCCFPCCLLSCNAAEGQGHHQLTMAEPRTNFSLTGNAFGQATDVRSKQLVPQCLDFVEAGAEEATKKLKFCLRAEDLAWLRDHQGRFQACVPLSSLHCRTKVTSVQMRDKLPSEIAERCLTTSEPRLA